MKKRFFVIPIIVLVFLSIITNSCNKDEKNDNSPIPPPVLIPVLTTNSVYDITQTSAICGGNITSDGGATITARGVCWGTSSNPTNWDNKTNDGTGPGNFTSNITGLTAEITYGVRSYATNIAGTAYGNVLYFTTPQSPVTDIDGNIYHYKSIGTQVWMLENLKTTRYNDGTSIPNITDGGIWINTGSGAYCDYGNNPGNSAIYGRLYNHAAVITGKLCPPGWHVPTAAEWATLIAFLGGEHDAGGKLKGGGYWEYHQSSTCVTNSSGFTALPSGFRDSWGYFDYIKKSCGFWYSDRSEHQVLYYDDCGAYTSTMDPSGGFSVRCIKDN